MKGCSEATLPNFARLTKPREFERVLSGGNRIKAWSGRFDLKYTLNELGTARLGYVVPKRYTPLATERNRLKRLIREAYRHLRCRLPAVDIVTRQIAPVTNPHDPDLNQELEALFFLFVSRESLD